MRKYLFLSGVVVLALSCNGTRKQITPVPFDKVRLTDGFWKERMKTEIGVTVPFSIQKCDPAIERFEQCVAYVEGTSDEPARPHRFISSDMYKVLEGAAYSLMISPNPQIEAKIDSVAALIARAQRPDGYLYITHICGNPIVREMGTEPYSYVVHSHELYNMGHFYEAAVAYWQATGKTNLLDIAQKSAKHINKVFFEGDPAYNGGKPVNQAPGHEEIELALCKMYRCTGNELYLDMAKKFLDIRGITYVPDYKEGDDPTMNPEYAQQHLPVTVQDKPVGHAVRAGYLYSGMAQVDALTGNNDYGKALNAIWTNLVSTKMHITGGLGAVREVEGFGKEYELPNKMAYDETCAAVANVFFNEGMFLATGDAKFLDVAEVSIFNNALAGISLSGDRFFYVNPLEADSQFAFNHGSLGRSAWFDCSCCPPNISRLILQMPGYMYSYTDDDIYVMLFSGSSTEIPLAKANVAVRQTTEYPFSGKTVIELTPSSSSRFALRVRIPQWASADTFIPGDLYTYASPSCGNAEVLLNGKQVHYSVEKGFAVIDRCWDAGDVVEINLPMCPRYVRSDERVADNAGKMAVVCGPLVYCAEGVDNPQWSSLSIDQSAEMERFVFGEGMLGGIPGFKCANGLTIVPYYAWDNRGDGQNMKVWIDCK